MHQESVRLLLLVVTLFNTVNSQEERFATECMTPNNEIGLCLEIQGCRKLFLQVELNNTSSFEFIRASRCGPPNENLSKPKVCCGPDINFVNRDESIGEAPFPIQRTTTTTMTPMPQLGNDVLPKACGKQIIFIGDRIYGGTEAGVGEFPWLARLIHLNKYNKTRLGCSAFLIHKRFVLTAAHCLLGEGVKHLGPLNGVVLGMHNDTKARICTSKSCTDPPLAMGTLPPIIHDGYDSNMHTHDIALIPLSYKVNFTDFIKAICVQNIATNTAFLTISGWGRTEADATSRTKLKVELPMFNRTNCGERYRSLGLAITNMQICAGGEEGQDSCSGDSGGPLMALGHDGLWYAEGIVSFGNGCGREGWPGVYTNIPGYYNWIIEKIQTVKKYKFRSERYL